MSAESDFKCPKCQHECVAIPPSDCLKCQHAERPLLIEPLPCPFCGSKRIVKGDRYFAMCVDCGATGPERNSDATERKFVGDWNTRI